MTTKAEAALRAEAEALAGDADLRDCLYLVSKGVPFDVAFSLDEAQRLAWVVILGEFDGPVYDWSSGTWSRRE